MRKGINGIHKIILIMFVLVYILSGNNVLEAQAATKTKLETTEIKVGVNGTEKIKLKKKNKRAEYSYSSSDKNIATVNQNGKVKGRNYGNVQIEVIQELNGKKDIIGTVGVEVKKAEINQELLSEYAYELTTQPGTYNNFFGHFGLMLGYLVDYYNYEATYTFYSDDESKLEISEKGAVKNVKESGEVKVIIKENYRGKERTVGSFSVLIGDPKLVVDSSEEQIVKKGDSVLAYEYVNYYVEEFYAIVTDSIEEPTKDNYMNLLCMDGVESLLFVYDTYGYWTGELSAEETGVEYIHYWAYDYEKEEYNLYLGYVTVKVEE